MFDDDAKVALLDGLSVAKDRLGRRIGERNSELLAAKRKRALDDAKSHSRALTPEQIAKIALRSDETLSYDIEFSSEETFDRLRRHTDWVRGWSAEVGFRDLRGRKDVQRIFVELDTWLTPLSAHMEDAERAKTTPLIAAVYNESRHAIILGQPGAGKTTSMKKLCSDLLRRTAESSQRAFVPLVIRLRELNTTNTDTALLDAIASIVGIRIAILNNLRTEITDLAYPPFIALIEAIAPIIVLDGFDEIRTYALKEKLLVEIRLLCSHLRKAKLVLTCRSGEFNFYVDGADVFEIAPLTATQVEAFAHRWIEDRQEAGRFVEAVRASPYYDAAMRPLALAHLCAIFERAGRIPERPKTIYSKVVGLLLDQWDEQRSIRRESRYAAFDSDRKQEFLAHLAYYLTTVTRSTVFERAQFAEAYRAICPNFGLEVRFASRVVAELESHTGLFLKCGYDRYEFAHKSFQEFLAADYLVKLPTTPIEVEILKAIPNELAIATSISSNPSAYFCDLVLGRFAKAGLPCEFFDTFVSRLTLERPTFYAFDELAIALCMLQTLWVCEGKVTGREVNIRRLDSMAVRRFCEFRDRVPHVDMKSKLQSYYYVSQEDPIPVGDVTLFKASRRRQHQSYSLPTYLLTSG